MDGPAFPKPSKQDRKDKKRKGAKAYSAKRKKRSRLYRLIVRPAYLAGLAAGQNRRGQKALCERCAKHIGEEVHHVAGRQGEALIDPKNLALMCKPCHDYLHDRPSIAREEGWIKSRHGYHREKMEAG